jgi:hypothetical protein
MIIFLTGHAPDLSWELDHRTTGHAPDLFQAGRGNWATGLVSGWPWKTDCCCDDSSLKKSRKKSLKKIKKNSMKKLN